jgi:hypothetical protein
MALSPLLTTGGREGVRPFRPGSTVQVVVHIAGETRKVGQFRVGPEGELDFSGVDLDIVMVGTGHDGNVHAPRLILGDEGAAAREAEVELVQNDPAGPVRDVRVKPRRRR